MQTLNINEVDLKRSAIIEASAGTGKTYSLTGLVVRLIIGYECQKLDLDKILLVTFTEAATADLKRKVLEKLIAVREAFELAYILESDKLSNIDPFAKELIENLFKNSKENFTAKLQEWINSLKVAERQIDKASISTIHSFCQNMLKKNAFESGVLFKNKFVDDETQIELEAIVEEFRDFFYHKEMDLLKREINRDIPIPVDLIQILKKFQQADRIFPDPNPQDLELDKFQEYYEDVIKYLKEYFGYSAFKNKSEDQNEDQKEDKTEDKKKYRIEVDISIIDDFPLQYIKNLCNQILNLDKTKDFSHLKNVYGIFARKDLGNKKSIKKEKAKIEQETDFRYDDFEKVATSFIEIIDNYFYIWINDFFKNSIQRKNNVKKLLNLMSFDDLIKNLQNSLNTNIHGQNAELLAAKIRDSYPIAMIDEFQDTDKAQYNIFYNTYLKHPGVTNKDGYTSALFIIGDPKQSIYRFRGADINTYFFAKEQNEKIKYAHQTGQAFNMDTNHRSTPSIVESVNTMFSMPHDPDNSEINDKSIFKTNKIQFLPVNAVEKSKLLVWKDSDQEVEPIIFTDLKNFSQQEINDNKYKKNLEIRRLANVCAYQLHTLFTKARYKKENSYSNLQLSDFAVLVMNETEAKAVKKALSEYGIKSIYLSDKSSIQSLKYENEFIINFMEAILFLREMPKVRKLIADPLLNLSLLEMNTIINDHSIYNKFLSILGKSKELWEQHGFMSALYNFIHEPTIKLITRLREFADGEQLITNVLQIAEKIQVQETKESTPYSLYAWFLDYEKKPIAQADVQKEKGIDEIRLDSDQQLVSIVTVFKSKGLEYPIVLLPFLGIENMLNETLLYHTPATADDREFKLGESISNLNIERVKSPISLYNDLTRVQLVSTAQVNNKDKKEELKEPLSIALTKKEILQEKVRLLYVALTRARYCNCFAISLGIKPKPYHGQLENTNSSNLNGFERVSLLGTTLVEATQAGETYNLSELWQKYLNRLDLAWKDKKLSTQPYLELGNPNDPKVYELIRKGARGAEELQITKAQDRNLDLYEVAKFDQKIDQTWAITSYSRLVACANRRERKYDLPISVNERTDELDRENNVPTQNIKSQEYIMDQFTFPRGTKPGDFLHKMLEGRDFQYQLDNSSNNLPQSQGSLEAYIAEIIKRGFFADSRTLNHWRELEGIEALTQWFKNIVDTPLTIGDQETVRLSDIDLKHRLSEADFTFKLGDLDYKKINSFYKKYYDQSQWLKSLHDCLTSANAQNNQLNELFFNRVNGFVTGQIDLTFIYKGKYYILDYKSNYLGDHCSDYSRLAMAKAVAEHRYDFQYSIYTLALYRYLKARIKNLDFSKVFGGIIYLFIRGCDPNNPLQAEKHEDALGDQQIYGCYDVKLPQINENNDFITALDQLFDSSEE